MQEIEQDTQQHIEDNRMFHPAFLPGCVVLGVSVALWRIPEVREVAIGLLHGLETAAENG